MQEEGGTASVSVACTLNAMMVTERDLHSAPSALVSVTKARCAARQTSPAQFLQFEDREASDMADPILAALDGPYGLRRSTQGQALKQLRGGGGSRSLLHDVT